jgi:hypothetical protein
MKYALEMGSGARINKDWFRHSKLIGEIHRHTNSMEIA